MMGKLKDYVRLNIVMKYGRLIKLIGHLYKLLINNIKLVYMYNEFKHLIAFFVSFKYNKN